MTYYDQLVSDKDITQANPCLHNHLYYSSLTNYLNHSKSQIQNTDGQNA